MNMKNLILAAMIVVTGCVVDTGDEQISEMDTEVVAVNQLSAAALNSAKYAASAIGGSGLSSNSSSIRALVNTANGRAVMAVVVSCALPSSASVSATDLSGTSYSYQGSMNLAPNWQNNVPSTADKRWTTACILARTNVYNINHTLSLRNDLNINLQASMMEKSQYATAEAGFYGNLFQAAPALYACASQIWVPSGNPALEGSRACSKSSNGTTTNCGFSYTWLCGAALSGHPAACSDKTAPYGSCSVSGTSYGEVVTTFSTP